MKHPPRAKAMRLYYEIRVMRRLYVTLECFLH